MKSEYITLISYVIDYGSVVYGSAAKSLLNKLDVNQAQALRVRSGAIKTSPFPG